jgi:hypothetical protein
MTTSDAAAVIFTPAAFLLYAVCVAGLASDVFGREPRWRALKAFLDPRRPHGRQDDQPSRLLVVAVGAVAIGSQLSMVRQIWDAASLSPSPILPMVLGAVEIVLAAPFTLAWWLPPDSD